jgi:tyrosine-protein phosphatase SIW14
MAACASRSIIEELKKLGIDTIVDLRGEGHGLMEKDARMRSRWACGWCIFPGPAGPRDEQIAHFFALLSETPRRKIFIHCWFGGDRDEMFVAAYRIAFDGWTPEEAIHEMRAFHFKEFPLQDVRSESGVRGRQGG